MVHVAKEEAEEEVAVAVAEVVTIIREAKEPLAVKIKVVCSATTARSLGTMQQSARTQRKKETKWGSLESIKNVVPRHWCK